MAALCHDIGHLPFSHAAEKELLPDGWDHERITAKLIRGNELTAVWQSMTPPLNPDHIAKVAIGPEKMQKVDFSNWEILLSEIIVGDALGVDRTGLPPEGLASRWSRLWEIRPLSSHRHHKGASGQRAV